MASRFWRQLSHFVTRFTPSLSRHCTFFNPSRPHFLTRVGIGFASCHFMKKIITAFLILISFISITSPVMASQCTEVKSGKSGDFKGEASIVYFYMGDSYLTTLAQETVVLSKAFEKADYKILLYDDNATATSKISSAKAISQADALYDPTKAGLVAAINEAIDEGYVVNLWIFSHGSTYTKSDGSEVAYFKAQDGLITEDYLKRELGADCDLPIRMVYSGACFHSQMNDTWRSLGAKAAVGARWINFYPTQYGRFTDLWNQGKSFTDAVAGSNTAAGRTVVQTYIAALSLEYSGKGDCSLIPNVLGETDCAAWFFTGGGPYDFGDDYNETLSGKENMNKASKKIIAGDKQITRNTVLTWEM